MFSEEVIQQAGQGEIQALIELDCNGLLIGADESIAEYTARLRRLQANTASMNASLKRDGTYAVEGIEVDSAERIPPELFREIRTVTESLYAFAVDWVPGFFINPSFGWLFGGCAFYFYPDFFALFIIRKSFADRERWLIYSRDELLAHELCHIGRIGMGSTAFEEILAYQTATSAFRRVVGSVFRGPGDSFLLLGGTFLLLGAQLVRVFLRPTMWIWPFWALILAVITFLSVRHICCSRIFSRALRNMSALSSESARPVLFRCTDSEIRTIARMQSSDELRDWVAARAEHRPRWRVVCARFLAEAMREVGPEDGPHAATPSSGM